MALSEELTRKQKTEVQIREGVSLRHDFEFPPAAAIYGTVRGIRYGEMAGMAVFQGDLSGTVFTLLSDFEPFEKDRVLMNELPPDGLFQLDTLEPGTYTLIAAAAPVREGEPIDPNISFRMVSQLINVKAGEAQFLELTIP